MTGARTEVDAAKIAQAVRMILEAVGEDPDREGLRETPQRVARMYAEAFAGLRQDPRALVKVFSDEEHEELVLVKDIAYRLGFSCASSLSVAFRKLAGESPQDYRKRAGRSGKAAAYSRH